MKRKPRDQLCAPSTGRAIMRFLASRDVAAVRRTCRLAASEFVTLVRESFAGNSKSPRLQDIKYEVQSASIKLLTEEPLDLSECKRLRNLEITGESGANVTFPAGLLHLTWSNGTGSVQLPRGLRTLRVFQLPQEWAPQLRECHELETLHIADSDVFRTWGASCWPPNLQKLITEGFVWTDIQLPASLTELHMVGGSFPSYIPPGLHTVHVTCKDANTLGAVPSSVRSLRVLPSLGGDSNAPPATSVLRLHSNLEVLDLTFFPGVKPFPAVPPSLHTLMFNGQCILPDEPNHVKTLCLDVGPTFLDRDLKRKCAHVTHLQVTRDNYSVEPLGSYLSTLPLERLQSLKLTERFSRHDCSNVNWHALAHLEHLDYSEPKPAETMDLSPLTRLESLRITKRCFDATKAPPHLKHLTLRGGAAFECPALGALDNLQNLRTLSVKFDTYGVAKATERKRYTWQLSTLLSRLSLLSVTIARKVHVEINMRYQGEQVQQVTICPQSEPRPNPAAVVFQYNA